MKNIEQTTVPGVTDHLDNLFDVSHYKSTKMRRRTIIYDVKLIEVIDG